MNDRYIRQVGLFPPGGQKKLGNSSILIVGAGGLGSPLLYYLCAAGFGRIGIADSGAVEVSNLNRQILYDPSQIGFSKTASAIKRLREFNDSVQFTPHPHITEDNAREIFSGYDIIADCTDNEPTRFLINKTALILDKFLAEGGINGFSGFVMSVKRGCACYGCLKLPHKPDSKPIASIGAAAGAVASLQAAECIKAALSIGEGVFNKALMLDIFNGGVFEMPVERDPQCPLCGGLY
ncbi:MAG: HesA/MoeB/ThiF family protein [Eubacteriaceae bacterium]|nr:HesA/MoeB/ThiF family protein [Eubacteriaceae bacterium]